MSTVDKQLIIGIADGQVSGVTPIGFALPSGVEIIVRNYDQGNEPDESGDLYLDVLLETTSPPK